MLVVDARRDPEADRRDALVRQRLAPAAASTVEQRLLRSGRRRRARPIARPCRRGRPARRGSSSRRGRPRYEVCAHRRPGNLPRRMAREEKPYRVYRGGRAKGQGPDDAPPGRNRPDRRRRRRRDGAGRRTAARAQGRAAETAPDRPLGEPRGARARRAGRRSGASSATCRSRSGVSDANKRLDPDAKAALTKQSGLLLSHSTTILLLGTDNADSQPAAGDDHSDSIMLLRTDPSHHRLYYLSIPRDLVVAIPGVRHAEDQRRVPDRRRRARDQDDPRSSPACRSTTSWSSTSASFKELIDAIGGIDDQRARSRSGRTASTAPTRPRRNARSGRAGASPRATQHMNGERALIYSRIRENLLDPARDRRHPRRAPAGGDRRRSRRS